MLIEKITLLDTPPFNELDLSLVPVRLVKSLKSLSL